MLTSYIQRCRTPSFRPVAQFRKRVVRRRFHVSAAARTDGVYRELTAMRVATPFVEALRQRAESDHDGPKPTPTPAAPDLTPKRMSDSYHSVLLPLAQDPWLLDNYLTSSGHIRLGTLFMDLDALSGIVSYKHTGDSVMTVTAAVDRIQLRRPLNRICDLQLSGQVTYATGRSSMEVSMQVAKAPAAPGGPVADEDVLVTCTFTMVSLDPATKKPVHIAPLRLDTREELQLYNMGQSNSESKKTMASSGLRRAAPNQDEAQLIHDMWRQQQDFSNPRLPAAREPANLAYMDHTRVHNVAIMQPQYRNRHSFMIFGGYLLKQTFELAFSCAAAFSHSRPAFLSLDPSTFDNPVPVGSVLYLTATVAYTEPVESHESAASNGTAKGNNGKNGRGTRIQIRVDSKVRDVEHAATKPTGQFNYTFLVDRDVQVMPRSYSEFMIWVDARRRARHVNASIEGNGPVEPPILRHRQAP